MVRHEHPASRALLTVAEVAERLAVSKRTVWVIVSSGKLTPIRLGRRTTRLDASEVEAFIEEARQRGEVARRW